MCLTVNKTFKTRQEARDFKPYIADKDITVYKVIRENGLSPYQNFAYNKGYHYYQEGKQFTKYISNSSYGWNIHINQGLHSYKTYRNACSLLYRIFTPWIKIVKMVIPAGSLYYEGNNGDIVSNNLIYY